MATETLPPVARSFSTFCKKCDTERYHTVLAHPTPTSAKMKCEICGATSTYKLGAKKSTAGSVSGKAKVTRAPRASKLETMKAAHEKEYQEILEKLSAAETANYNMREKFKINQKVQHPKFGLGVIRLSYDDKIEVVFADEVRSLIHNRV